MTHIEIRKKFLKFFEERGHKIVPSSSLLPDDPSVLFTTAGMQQFKRYYTGEADPSEFKLDDGSVAKGTVSIQKSMRTSDIDEVGDETHDTFFEMLGNFSFGGYWKEKAIKYAHEFIVQEMGLKISHVAVFKGNDVVPKDEESKKIWQSLDVVDIREEGMEDVFWGPTGTSGPCGPTTEVYVKSAMGQNVEVWNIVFNEFFCDGSREQLLKGEAKLKPLNKKGIDTGMGLERLAMVSQNVENIFDTDLFKPLMDVLPESLEIRTKRIIADHIRASVFLISDGVIPSNKDQGSILRKLMRVVMTQESILGSLKIHDVFGMAIKNYINFYPNLSEERIKLEWQKEQKYFATVLTSTEGLKKSLDEYKEELKSNPVSRNVSTQVVAGIIFDYKQSKGLPLEISVPTSILSGVPIDPEQLKAEEESFISKHAAISAAGAEKKFGGHGLILDTGELKAADENELKIVTRLHTATHMLHAALRKVLGEEVHQAGSDITAERLRFDFTFPRKVTPEEIKKVEELVNQAVKDDLTVTKEEMPYEEAVKTGALSFFKLKYPPKVNVYSVGPNTVNDPSGIASGPPFSRELCGGPHVTHTGEIGHFKITKEEASSAGVRRIRAIVE